MISINFIESPLKPKEQTILTDAFKEHSISSNAPVYDKRPMSWCLYDTPQRLVGALTTELLWDWMYIDELWVDKDYRRQGHAHRLMTKAEQKAKSENCQGLWLWTQSWQAEKFYQRMGFEIFTEFPNFPRGHRRIGFRKLFSLTD